MHLCTFRSKEEAQKKERIGFVKDGKVFEPVEELAIMDYLRTKNRAPLKLSNDHHQLKDVVICAPISRPGKIIAAIVNTRGMLGGDDMSLDRPRLDMKVPSTVIGPREEIRAPPSGIRPEVELAAVIGKGVTSATPEEARKSIFGYTILNDVTAPADSKSDAYEAYRRDKASGDIRKMTMRGPLFRSKNHDTFCPIGPWVATADDLDPSAGLAMTARFRGTPVQEGSTAEYLFKPWEIVSYVSGFLSLEPGDIISCGSVGWTQEALKGLDPTEYVLPSGRGDLDLEIAGIGTLSNPVVPA